MMLVSKSAAVLMPAGSRRVLLAPTHTCTSLPDHISLTSAKPEILINHVSTRAHLLITLIAVNIITRSFLSLSPLKRQTVFVLQKADFLFCLRFRFFDFSSPWRKKSLEGGQLHLDVQYSTSQVGVPICLFYSGHSRWFEGRSGRFETSSTAAVNEQSCQSLLFEVFDSYVSKQSNHIRLRSVWCWNFWKKKCQKRCAVFYVFKLTFFFWEVEMNSYHNVRVFTVSELIKQNWIIACYLEYFNILFFVQNKLERTHFLLASSNTVVAPTLWSDWTEWIHPSLIYWMSLTPAVVLPLPCKLFSLFKGNEIKKFTLG